MSYDGAIAALYFPRLIESTRVFVTVTPTSDLMPLSSLGFRESYFLVFFYFFSIYSEFFTVSVFLRSIFICEISKSNAALLF